MADLDPHLCYAHRYTREIPEPVPFLSQHWAQIGGDSSGFSCNQNNHGLSGVCLSPASTAV